MYRLSSLFKKPRALLLMAMVFTSCEPQPPASANFYYFKSTFDVNPQEAAVLDELNTGKLYLRLFDMNWNSQAAVSEVVSPLHLKEFPDSSFQIIPVIFITNATLRQQSGSLPDLYAQIEEALQHYIETFSKQRLRVSELQFDCDWTASTQADYFALLQHFQSRYPGLEITSTIRLHQLKLDKQMRVPPVNRGVLMCYNTGNIRDPGEINSILNLDVASMYLPHLRDYPLQLHMALPLFSWGVQYRFGEIVSLLRDLREEHLLENPHMEQTVDNKFTVTKSHYLNGQYIYKDDEIRYEFIGEASMMKLVEMLRRDCKSPIEEVVFYHLDERVLASYSPEFLQAVAKGLNP